MSEEEADAPSFFRILRAPEPELLEEPDDRAAPELPPEPPSFLTLGELAPWLPPSRLTDVEPVPWPDDRPTDSRPTPRSGTRLPEPASLRSITRLPLSGWTEILVPVGLRFRVLLERLTLLKLFSAAVSLSATRDALGALSWSRRTTVRARDPVG
jgi:hypothetical protein